MFDQLADWRYTILLCQLLQDALGVLLFVVAFASWIKGRRHDPMKSDASDESSYETSDTFENPIDEKGEVDRDTLQRVVVQGDVEATLPTPAPRPGARSNNSLTPGHALTPE